jgi:hypothetical protein
VIPALVFGVIAVLTGKGWFKFTLSNTITAVLVGVLGMSSFMGVILMSMRYGTSQTTNEVSRYERVLRLRTNNSNRTIFEKFPQSIPATASDVAFSYNYSSWLDFSETMTLQFTESPERIMEYIVEFSAKAESSNTVDGFMVYLLYRSDAGSSGRKSTVSISAERNKIIFFAQRWSR